MTTDTTTPAQSPEPCDPHGAQRAAPAAGASSQRPAQCPTGMAAGPGGGTPQPAAPAPATGVTPYHAHIDLSAPADDRPADKPLLDGRDLPGPLSMHLLTTLGTLSPLDDGSAYQTDQASTLYGRAMIIAHLAPRRTIACAFTAAWIWLGGPFPGTIDVISRSHYRSVVHGRAIRVFNRKSIPEHLIKIGRVCVTTPARTACDLALLPQHELEGADAGQLIDRLMAEYHVTPEACLKILDLNRYWPRAPFARNLFEKLEV